MIERTALEQLRLDAPEVGAAFAGLRQAIGNAGTLSSASQELVLVATLALAGERDAFTMHVQRAREHGLTTVDLKQAILLMLGSTMGLPDVVRALGWIDAIDR